MARPNFLLTLGSAAILAALSGCGGGATAPENQTSELDNSNQSAQTTTTTTTTAQTPEVASQTDSITGRVADGYIQGAVVCLDLNENRSCDDDEPSVLSGEGGVYELEVSAAQAASPIVADVPASAIDEDTNEAIGRELVLSTPPGHPEFISPITTLVHQQLQDNPSLDVDQAEASVKEDLGLVEASDASLFTDYVSNSRDSDSAQPEQFLYLHQTAQIVARMMQEIQSEIELAVTAEGVDLAGDQDARRAMQRLLRDEVRRLLPEITRAVSQRQISDAEPLDGEPTQGESEAQAFDPDALASSLLPNLSTIDANRLQAEVERRPAESVSVEEILSEGFYWIDIDCDRYDAPLPETTDINPDQGVSVERPASFVEQPFNGYCAAEYGHIILSDTGDSVVESRFEYDSASATWSQRIDDDAADQPSALRLVDGEWVAIQHDTEMRVEFTADGGAIITGADGKMQISAARRDLTDRPLLHHLWERRADFADVGAEQLFPNNSAAYLFSLRRAERQYALLNWQSHDGDGACDQFNGNCNVVQTSSDNGLDPVENLTRLIAASTDGVTLAGLMHDFNGQPIDAELSAANEPNATQGRVKWCVNAFNHEQSRPADMVPMPENGVEGGIDSSPPDGSLTDGTQPLYPDEFVCVDLNGQPDIDFPLPDSGFPTPPEPDQRLQDDALEAANVSPETFACIDPEHIDSVIAEDDAGGVSYPPGYVTSSSRRSYGNSQWRVIDVQGVRMIELTIPVAMRHQLDLDDAAAVLLVEQNGFIRRGIRFNDRGSDSETMYNPTAFAVMRQVMQNLVSTPTVRD